MGEWDERGWRFIVRPPHPRPLLQERKSQKARTGLVLWLPFLLGEGLGERVGLMTRSRYETRYEGARFQRDASFGAAWVKRAHSVLYSPHTAGPAEIHACGGGFGPRHDGIRHRVITDALCASASPGIPCRKAGERPNLYGSSRRVSGNGPTTPSNRQAIAIIVWRGANSGRDTGSLKDEHHSQRTSGCLAVDAASSRRLSGRAAFCGFPVLSGSSWARTSPGLSATLPCEGRAWGPVRR